MASKPQYSKNAAVAMFIGYERGQCSRKAKIGSLCTQHEKIRLHQEFLKAREEREKICRGQDYWKPKADLNHREEI